MNTVLFLMSNDWFSHRSHEAHEEHLLRSCLPSGCNKQQAALLYADKPAAVATDAHFASAAKPTTASLLRCSLRELREICVRQKASCQGADVKSL